MHVLVVPVVFNLWSRSSTTQATDIAPVIGAIKLGSATARDRNWTPYTSYMTSFSASVVSVGVAG